MCSLQMQISAKNPCDSMITVSIAMELIVLLFIGVYVLLLLQYRICT